MKKTGFVYKWTNSINKRWYIGSHKGSTDDGYRHSSKILAVAEKKYGLENFTREILFVGDYEVDKIKAKEAEYLQEADAATNPMSYNLSNITGPNCYSPEVCEKISKALGGRPKSAAHKRKLKEIFGAIRKGKTYEEIYGNQKAAEIKILLGREGADNHMYGKSHTTKTKKKISKALMTPKMRKFRSERMLGDKNPTKRLEVRQKISEAGKGRTPWNKGQIQKTIYCPFCDKSGGLSVMKRWHFDNCKNNNE